LGRGRAREERGKAAQVVNSSERSGEKELINRVESGGSKQKDPLARIIIITRSISRPPAVSKLFVAVGPI
jgi:hypothetical protein